MKNKKGEKKLMAIITIEEIYKYLKENEILTIKDDNVYGNKSMGNVGGFYFPLIIYDSNIVIGKTYNLYYMQELVGTIMADDGIKDEGDTILLRHEIKLNIDSQYCKILTRCMADPRSHDLNGIVNKMNI
jgi:hypothetical protein